MTERLQTEPAPVQELCNKNHWVMPEMAQGLHQKVPHPIKIYFPDYSLLSTRGAPFCYYLNFPTWKRMMGEKGWSLVGEKGMVSHQGRKKEDFSHSFFLGSFSVGQQAEWTQYRASRVSEPGQHHTARCWDSLSHSSITLNQLKAQRLTWLLFISLQNRLVTWTKRKINGLFFNKWYNIYILGTKVITEWTQILN